MLANEEQINLTERKLTSKTRNVMLLEVVSTQ
jgi:hypothetical protein